MYNRYTRTQDGSYRRSVLPETVPVPSPAPAEETPPQEPVVKEPKLPKKAEARPPQPPLQFLSGLFPRDMDSGDLLVLLILLLLLADGNDQAGSPLLTLALFFLLN